MRKIKHLSIAVMLTFMLGATAFAGEIHIDKTPPPPGSSSLAKPTDLASPSDTQIVGVTDVMLNLLESMLSVF